MNMRGLTKEQRHYLEMSNVTAKHFKEVAHGKRESTRNIPSAEDIRRARRHAIRAGTINLSYPPMNEFPEWEKWDTKQESA